MFAPWIVAASMLGAPTALTVDKDRVVATQTSVPLRGSLDLGYTRKPLWFEVHSAQGGLVDYGAAPAASQWHISARHLRFGDNKVTIHARGGDSTTQTVEVIVTLPETAEPSVRPRPVPAEIWWGRMFSPDLLPLMDAATWPFVQRHTDAYMVHSYGGWGGGGPPNDLARTLAGLLLPHDVRFAAELGGGTMPLDDWPDAHLRGWGGWSHTMEDLGIVWSELTHDYQHSAREFCEARPTWSEQQIVDYHVAQWRRVYEGYRQQFPHAVPGQTTSPVWWRWRDFPALGDRNLLDVQVGGKAFHLDAAAFMEGMSRMARQVGYEVYPFYSDAPNYSLDWGIDSEREPYRAKMLAYERWLHQTNNSHTLLCMGPNPNPGNSDAWDRQYSQESLKQVVTWQTLGGRADRYNFESFYSEGPHVVVPETRPDSYTNTILQAIVMLKGISPRGGLESLRLTATTSGNDGSIKLTNTGDAACLPALVARESGDNAVRLRYSFEGKDITAAMQSEEGFVPAQLLPVGAALTINVRAEGPGSRTANIEAFWNPQDPTGVVRDRARLAFGSSAPPPSSPPPPSPTPAPGSRSRKLINAATGLCLDVTDGDASAGANIQLWRCTGEDRQRFEAVPGPANTVSWRTRAGKCLDVFRFLPDDGANVLQWDCHGGVNQQFVVKPWRDGWSTVTLPFSGKCLDAANGGKAPGDNVRQMSCNGSPQQAWAIVESTFDDGKARALVSAAAGTCVDLAGNVTASGTFINGWSCNQSAAQAWGFAFTGVDGAGEPWYNIVHAESGRCADVSEISQRPGARLWLWPCLGAGQLNQLWSVRANADGTYSARVRHSGQRLDLDRGGSADGTFVMQYPDNDSAAQRWRLVWPASSNSL